MANNFHTLQSLSQQLYEFKKLANALQNENEQLEAQLEANEEELITALMASAELYEMVIMMNSESEVVAQPMMLKARSVLGGDKMVQVYVTLILKGRKQLHDVPMTLRARVEEELKALLEVEELPAELL